MGERRGRTKPLTEAFRIILLIFKRNLQLWALNRSFTDTKIYYLLLLVVTQWTAKVREAVQWYARCVNIYSYESEWAMCTGASGSVIAHESIWYFDLSWVDVNGRLAQQAELS